MLVSGEAEMAMVETEEGPLLVTIALERGPDSISVIWIKFKAKLS